MRSRHSTAPIYGGGSWMSLATIQTGVRVKNQQTYDQLTRVADRYPHLTRYFATQGYQTVAVQPGNTRRPGLRSFDPYQRDVLIEAPDLGYTGREFGWGKIPDQYSLGYAAEAIADIEAPVFFFFVGVTTHAPWDEVPPVLENWRALNNEALTPTHASGYLETIRYEWSALERFIESTADDESVYIVLGDHQPALRRRERAATYDAPVHVLSRDADFIAYFDDYGFEPGLVIESSEAPSDLRHEGLYSLIISSLRP